MKRIKLLLLILFAVFACNAYSQNRASLTIVNRSDYIITVKLMKSHMLGDSLYSTIQLAPQKTRTIYVSETGTYYTKTKAEKNFSPTMYNMGRQFYLKSGMYEYSESTLEFYISSYGGHSMGESISRSEFEKDN